MTDKRTRELLLTNQVLLRAIYGQLTMQQQSEHTVTYECLVCHDSVPKQDRAAHGKRCFGYHKSMGESVLSQKYHRE